MSYRTRRSNDFIPIEVRGRTEKSILDGRRSCAGDAPTHKTAVTQHERTLLLPNNSKVLLTARVIEEERHVNTMNSFVTLHAPFMPIDKYLEDRGLSSPATHVRQRRISSSRYSSLS